MTASQENLRPGLPSGRVKGIGLRSTLRHIEKAHGPKAVAHVLTGLDRTDMPGPTGYLAATYHDLRIVDHVWRRYAELVSPTQDMAVLDLAFRKLGAFIAEDNLSTVYKLTLAVIGPDTLFSRLPSVWATYFETPGTRVVYQEESRGQINVAGLGGLSFLAPTACGWTVYAFGRVGARSTTCVESAWASGQVRPRAFEFTARWATGK